MKTRTEAVNLLCRKKGKTYSEAVEEFYAYWENKIEQIKKGRKAPSLLCSNQ